MIAPHSQCAAPGSEADQQDLATLLTLQAHASAARRAQTLTDSNEAEPYACRTWAKAVGAEPRTAGPLGGELKGVDMSDKTYSPGGKGGFRDEHSAEFNGDIQQVMPFYTELLSRLNIKQNQ